MEANKRNGFSIVNLLIAIIIIIATLFIYSRYIATKGLIAKEYRVESSILTKNFSGIKIVHFSDLLYKSTVDKNDLKTLVDRINEYKPDIVVFTGNLVTNTVPISTSDTNTLASELSRIKASIDKYAIYGEYDYKYKDYERVMTSSGFKILNNSYDEVYYKSNEPLYIVGLPSSLKENIDIESSFKFYKDDNRKYTICLVHEGASIKYIDSSDYEVDLILGGYSLNGSVVLPFVGGILNDKNSYKYSEPEYEKGITKIFISSGIGTKKYGYRFLNKPSFNVYRLKAQS